MGFKMFCQPVICQILFHGTLIIRNRHRAITTTLFPTSEPVPRIARGVPQISEELFQISLYSTHSVQQEPFLVKLMLSILLKSAYDCFQMVHPDINDCVVFGKAF